MLGTKKMLMCGSLKPKHAKRTGGQMGVWVRGQLVQKSQTRETNTFGPLRTQTSFWSRLVVTGNSSLPGLGGRCPGKRRPQTARDGRGPGRGGGGSLAIGAGRAGPPRHVPPKRSSGGGGGRRRRGASEDSARGAGGEGPGCCSTAGVFGKDSGLHDLGGGHFLSGPNPGIF